MSALTALLAAMVEIDTTNPSLLPGAPGEAALARFLARRLGDAGLEVELWDVLPGRPNVVARLRGAGRPAGDERPDGDEGRAGDQRPRSLMLCGHLDVVAAATPEAFAPRVEDGRMYGRGTADMKSGLAAAVTAVEALVASGARLAGDLYVAGLVDEEWKSAGAAALPERYRPDAAVMVECTGLDVVTEHGGFAWFDVESRGVEAAGDDTAARRGRYLAAGAGAGRHPPAGRRSGGAPARRVRARQHPRLDDRRRRPVPRLPGALCARRGALPDRRRVRRRLRSRDASACSTSAAASPTRASPAP